MSPLIVVIAESIAFQYIQPFFTLAAALSIARTKTGGHQQKLADGMAEILEFKEPS
jgi:hypothetical protein